MMLQLAKLVNRFARSVGYEITPFNVHCNHHVRKIELMKRLGITLVIDGGANAGQYGARIRALGYRQQIVSYEPIPAVFEKLQNRVQKDRNWRCENLALGERNGTVTLHINRITEVSSILATRPSEITSTWTDDGAVDIPIRTLDSLIPELASPTDKLYLKLDVQGYEKCALQGAANIVKQVVAIELEMSVVPFYESEPLYRELFDVMAHYGFDLYSVCPVSLNHRTGQLIQFEGLFVRSGVLL